MIRIEIPGRFPTLNQYRNAHFRTLHKWKMDWERVIWYVLSDMKIKPLTTPLVLSATTFSRSMRDVDGTVVATKFFLDTLVKKELIPDDNPKYVKSLILSWKKAEKDDEKVVFIIQ